MILFGWREVYVFCFKQKTAYELRISDWSSDVCSSDLDGGVNRIPKCTRNTAPVRTGAMFSTRIFRSRWVALLWAAGIIWTAIDVAEANKAPPPPASNASDAAKDRKSTRLNSSH